MSGFSRRLLRLGTKLELSWYFRFHIDINVENSYNREPYRRNISSDGRGTQQYWYQQLSGLRKYSHSHHHGYVPWGILSASWAPKHVLILQYSI